MMIGRRRFLNLAVAAVASPAVIRDASAQAPQVTLKLHHFLSPVANAHTRLLVPWARKLEKDSGNRIRIEIFPSMQLGGSQAQLYDQAREGFADLVWTLPGATPGRFPKIEVFELPFVANKRAVANAQAVQAFYEARLRDEFEDVHPICLWAHDRGVIHTNKQIKSLDDMKGLKLRSPTRFAGEALKALGATSIQMPITLMADALNQRAIDGCLVPWEVVPATKVQEAVKFHSDFSGSPTLYTTTFILAMNKNKYGFLPADLKKVIDQNSGQAAALMAGRMWDEQALAVEDMVVKRGNTVTQIDGADAARWQKATQPVIDAWLKSSKAINGEKLLADAKALLSKYRDA